MRMKKEENNKNDNKKRKKRREATGKEYNVHSNKNIP
jgi:hypothetical protein